MITAIGFILIIVAWCLVNIFSSPIPILANDKVDNIASVLFFSGIGCLLYVGITLALRYAI